MRLKFLIFLSLSLVGLSITLAYGINNPRGESKKSSTEPLEPTQANKTHGVTQSHPLTIASINSGPLSSSYLHYLAKLLHWHAGPSNTCGYFQEPKALQKYPHAGPILEQQTTITATGPVELTLRGRSILKKNVILTQPGRIITADMAYIDRDPKTRKITQVTLLGQVHLWENGKLLVADKTILKLDPKETVLIQAAYHVHNANLQKNKKSMGTSLDAWGTAQEIIRSSSGVLTIHKGSYTTCPPLDPAWEIRASEIVIDKSKQQGRAYHAVLRFKGFPLLYIPVHSFSLTPTRKSGFLTPKIGYSTRSGGAFGVPFYWNLAPNYDVLFTPMYLTRRNAQIGTNFRFLSEQSQGHINFNILPDDPAFSSFKNQSLDTYSNTALYDPQFYSPYLRQLNSSDSTRYFLSLEDSTVFTPEWNSHIQINTVSDSYFFQDLGPIVGSDTLSNQLLNRIDVNYTGTQNQITALVQGYQTLHLINQTTPPAADQYQRLPEVTWEGYYPNLASTFDLESNAQWVNFEYQSIFVPTQPIGQRLHWRTGGILPLVGHAGYLRPQVWADLTSYQTTQATAPLTNGHSGRILPLAALDSGLYFDRIFSSRGHSYLQTLEPRLFYLYVPYQNQDRLPNFDTVLLPFSFDQLFSLNRYTGVDRLGNANQASLALSSTLTDMDSGITLLKANVGTIAYFQPERVCLSEPTCSPNQAAFSPIVGDLSYTLSPRTVISTNISWDPSQKQINNAGISYTYQRDKRHIVGLGYNFVHSTPITLNVSTTPIYNQNTSQINLSFVWKFTDHWSTFNYWSYNKTEHRTDNFFTGLEYDTCCWAMQFVVQKAFAGTATTATGTTNRFDTVYFVQLQLKGLGELRLANIEKLFANTLPGFR